MILTTLSNLYFLLLNSFPVFSKLMVFHGYLEFKSFPSNIVIISPFVQKVEDPRRIQYRNGMCCGKEKDLFSIFLSLISIKNQLKRIKAIFSCVYVRGIRIFWNHTRLPCTWLKNIILILMYGGFLNKH